MALTKEERETNAETFRHILTIRAMLFELTREFADRGIAHDQSKLSPPEVDTFTKYTPLLKDVAYGSEEYKGFLTAMKPALDNHYENNSHHPEHFSNGIMGMNLFDLIEMLVDWKASSLRGKDGDLSKSLELNKERFQIPEALYQVMKNTLPRIQQAAENAAVETSYPK